MQAYPGTGPSISTGAARTSPLAACAEIWCLATARRFHPRSESDPDFLAFLGRTGVDTPRVTPFFDHWHYLEQAGPDAASENLVLHYCREGAARSIAPHPLLDPAHIAAQAGDAAVAPLLAFLREPARIDPHPLFEGALYAEIVGPAFLAGEPPALAFVRRWADRPAQFSRFFSWRHYLAHDPLAEAARVNPLLHFLAMPVAERAEPNPMFQRSWYAATLGARLPPGMEPLVHFLEIGRYEAAAPNPFAAAELALELGTRAQAAERLSRYIDVTSIDAAPAGRAAH